MGGGWWVYRVPACWVQVGAMTTRRSGAGHEGPEFNRADSVGCWCSSRPCWLLLAKFGQQRQRPGFLLSRPVQTADPTERSTRSSGLPPDGLAGRVDPAAQLNAERGAGHRLLGGLSHVVGVVPGRCWAEPARTMGETLG